MKNFYLYLSFFTFFTVIVFLSCKDNSELKISSNSTLFHGGNIITMHGENLETVESVVIEEDEIIFVGSHEEAKKKYPNSKSYDLKGNTLMPGFVEPHVRPSIAATMLPNDIIAPNDWELPSGLKKGVTGHAAYIEKITTSITSNAKNNEMYFIWGYHQLWHGELSKDIINNITTDKPVGIIHRSFHEIYLNDAAINFLGIVEENFKGNPQVEWEKGHFFEDGWLQLIPKITPIIMEAKRSGRGLGIMSQMIHKNGITTIAEPGFPSANFDEELTLLRNEMKKKPPYDVYLIPNGNQLFNMKGGNEEAMDFIETLESRYNTENIHFLPKQVKFFNVDGIHSDLGEKTECFNDNPNGDHSLSSDLFQEQIRLYWNNNYKIHVYANDHKDVLHVLELLKENQKKIPREEHRLTLHHLGYYTENMAEEIKNLGVEASVSPYQYSKLETKNPTPIKSLVERKIPVSFHSDFSNSPMEPLTLAFNAINPINPLNNTLSTDQAISVYDAMKSITIDAARTLNQEDKIGSIAKGKLANFVILKNNPFNINLLKIKDIEIKATIHKGSVNMVKSNNSINMPLTKAL